MHVDAVGRRARLPHVAHLGSHRARRPPRRGRRRRRRGTGALPPSSIEVRSTLSAHCSSSSLPTAGRAGEGQLAGEPRPDQRLHDLARVQGRHDVDRAVGSPASRRMSTRASIDSGVWWAGLTTMVHPAAMAGPDLAGAHSHGEVPRRNQQARPHRLLGDQEPGAARGRGLVAAGDPDGLVGEVAEELCGVRDLASGLRHRLAHLQGHEQSEIVDALVQQREGAGKDVGALPAEAMPRSRPAPRPRLRAPASRRPGWRRRPAEHLTRRRIEHIERGRSVGVDPLPADEELFRNRGQDRCFTPFVGSFHAPIVIARLTLAAGPIL